MKKKFIPAKKNFNQSKQLRKKKLNALIAYVKVCLTRKILFARNLSFKLLIISRDLLFINSIHII
jgi:hypothetical protein